MDKMYSASVFQVTPSPKEMTFNKAEFEKEPAKHVIDVCVSHIFHEIFNPSANIPQKNLSVSHIEIFKTDECRNLLMKSFSDFNNDLKEIIRLSIAQHAKNILKSNGMKFNLDQVQHSPGKISFRVRANFDGVTDVTLVFELIEFREGKTYVTCKLRSMQTFCCCYC